MHFRLTLGLLGASLIFGQTAPDPVYPAVSVAPPGTTSPSPVLLTQLPTGFAQQTVTTVTQRCITTPAMENESSSVNCTTITGDERYLTRAGSRLLPSGNTILEREETSGLNNVPYGRVISGIDLLDESNPLTPSIRQFASVDNAQITCVVSGTDQVTRTERGIEEITYNEPLKTLYVQTSNTTRYYQYPIGSEPTANACSLLPALAAATGVQVVEDSTRTLIRVIGPFEDMSIQSSWPNAPGQPGQPGTSPGTVSGQ